MQTLQLRCDVEFLHHRFHGTIEGQPEWPPAPFRLYQALVAGSKGGNAEWRSDSARLRSAFEWFEGLAPPVIRSSTRRECRPVQMYVPHNMADRVSSFKKKQSKILKPTYIDPPHIISYQWKFAAKDCANALVIMDETRHISSLGSPRDVVVVRCRISNTQEQDHSELPEEWLPLPYEGGSESRVPTPGSLRRLEEQHEMKQQLARGERTSSDVHWTWHKQVEYRQRSDRPGRQYAAFDLHEYAEPQVHANRVAAMTRSLVCRSVHRRDFAELWPQESPEVYLAGHTKKHSWHRGGIVPRFAYVPLPSIGHQHADGYIRRVLIVEPYGGDGEKAMWAQRRFDGTELVSADGQRVSRLTSARKVDSVTRRYTCSAREWFSVTPMVLHGYIRRGVTAESLALKALEHSDIDPESVEYIRCQKEPFTLQSVSALKYNAPAYLRDLPRRHVRIRFKDGMRGPLLIGPGMYAGLGVMAAAVPL